MSWLFAPNITAVHGFSTRKVGISSGAFHSLNLGGHEDDPQKIICNRAIALKSLNISSGKISLLKQVHGNEVKRAKCEIQTADALVTNEKQLPIAISVADCYPILFYDPVNKVIGAAHAGWRGTVERIAGKTVTEMIKLGAKPDLIEVAIGPGISCEQFQVGEEVIEKFVHSGFKSSVHGSTIDLIDVNKIVLQDTGILNKHIWSMNRCTTEADFFSYRRDNKNTGRMWALIML